MLSATQDVFESVWLIPADPEAAGLALLRWRATGQGDRVVQAYVNGGLHDVCLSLAAREMWVQLDRSIANRIELLAVDSADAWRDQRESLAAWNPKVTDRFALSVNRDEGLPIDASVVVEVDGVIRVDERLWSDADFRAGFGGLFGVGEFGRDAATGPGLGRGDFGFGGFGAGGTAWRWCSSPLEVGTHTVDARVVDVRGQTVAEVDPALICDADALPAPAASFAFTDGPTGLRLTWNP